MANSASSNYETKNWANDDDKVLDASDWVPSSEVVPDATQTVDDDNDDGFGDFSTNGSTLKANVWPKKKINGSKQTTSFGPENYNGSCRCHP